MLRMLFGQAGVARPGADTFQHEITWSAVAWEFAHV
jgi:hypothetical protein